MVPQQSPPIQAPLCSVCRREAIRAAKEGRPFHAPHRAAVALSAAGGGHPGVAYRQPKYACRGHLESERRKAWAAGIRLVAHELAPPPAGVPAEATAAPSAVEVGAQRGG